MGWPRSAIYAVSLLSVAAVVLLFVTLSGVRRGVGSYDPAAGGSMANWFEALGALVAVPAAVIVGMRQLRSTNEEIELDRQRLEAENNERAHRLRAEQALLRDAVQVRTYLANVVDQPDLATESERTAADRWRNEYQMRGWAHDTHPGGWERGGERSSTADLLTERSPLVPKPWFVAVQCTNTGTVTVAVQRWTVVAEDGTSTTVESHVLLRPGATVHRRIGADDGLLAGYAKRSDIDSRLATVTIIVDGCDAADRPFRIVARQE